MDQILPFGEVPQKMATSLGRTFLSSRAMYKAVLSAFDIADKMKSVSLTYIRRVHVKNGLKIQLFKPAVVNENKLVVSKKLITD